MEVGRNAANKNAGRTPGCNVQLKTRALTLYRMHDSGVLLEPQTLLRNRRDNPMAQTHNNRHNAAAR
eukprot:783367-Lingulodinium_polyedra.AAC.1